MHPLSAFFRLVLLSFALSISAIIGHETLEPTNANLSSHASVLLKNVSIEYERSDKTDSSSEPIETLFVPEDPTQYQQILLYVRQLFERAGQSIDPVDLETRNNPEENVFVDNVKLERLREKISNPLKGERVPEDEQYLRRNSGGSLPETRLKNNGQDQVLSMERNDYDPGYKGKSEPDEEDLLEAANFGLNAMKELYTVKEPTLYSMGLYLDSENPARHVAVFNGQTEEARTLAKYGFAVLQGTAMFRRKFPDASTDSLLSRRSQSNPLQRGCPNRGVPDCPPASLRYRTSDGSCNNLQHLWWGSAMSAMQRFLPPAYEDGIQSVRKSVTGNPLPGARLVTSVIHADKDIPLASVTHMLMQWGQFVDHDLTATGQSRGFNGSVPQCCLKFGADIQPPEFTHPECLPISVSKRDSFFGPLGVRCLEFVRSGAAPKEDCEFGSREQLSQVTSYLDASTVYSSNAFQSDSLRLFRNGLLQYGRIQSQRPVLPKLDPDLCRRGSLSPSCFRAGDGRLGEQPALTSLHVAFLRLHNRIATKLAALNAHWSDEKLFQESRTIVAAVIQHVTYREFLPIVLGQEVMKIFDVEVLRKGYFEGYDPTVNPTIANAFSTAAYRFGHSLVQNSFVRFDGNHRPILNNVSIHNEFTNPANLETAGSVDRLLLGLINQPAQRRDEHISEELTNHLFQTPNFPFGMDLASINIQRGRDHGIPAYIRWRAPCGLSPIRNFEELENAMPASTARKFRSVYSSVEDIDLFTGGLAEKSVKGGLVGPTFACIIGQQFSNLRRGDRFWYENSRQESSFTPGQLQQIRRVTLAQVLCATMDNIETVQPFVFLAQDSLKNQRLPCSDPAIGQLNLQFWAERPPRVSSRAGIFNKTKRKTTPGSTTLQRTNLFTPTTTTTTTTVTKNSVDEQKGISQRTKPPKASVHQQNRIVVKKPLGHPDNVTIVVQNNAINSPVFVNDAAHGSSIRINPSLNQQAQQMPLPEDRPPVPAYPSPIKPIPTAHPLANVYIGRPYVPYAFNDPSNPNPLSQPYRPGYMSSDVIFEGLPGTSPRPTLYTYYTNFQRPTTRKPPQRIDDLYTANDEPQYHATESSSWLESRYEPSSGNRQPYNGETHGTNTWQKVRYQYGAGYENFQGYKGIPNDSRKEEQQNTPKGPGNEHGSRNEYTSHWSSLPSDKLNDHQFRPIGPVYWTQSNRKPIQDDSTKRPIISDNRVTSTESTVDYSDRYQTDASGKPTVDVNVKGTAVNPNYIYFGASASASTLREKFNNSPSGSYDRNDYSTLSYSTPPYRPVQSNYYYHLDKSAETSYQTFAPSKSYNVHGVTIATNSPDSMSQAGHDEIDKAEDQVTGEIPKPLDSRTGNDNRGRKPGQYYYEQNVLRRYPDKSEDRKETYGGGEQRHKATGDKESIEQDDVIGVSVKNQRVIGGNRNGTGGLDTLVRKRNESSDSLIADHANQRLDGAYSEEIEDVASSNRTNHWLNPQEDSSLPSAPELPKIPSDKIAIANELPKPIKLRNYAS